MRDWHTFVGLELASNLEVAYVNDKGIYASPALPVLSKQVTGCSKNASSAPKTRKRATLRHRGDGASL